MTHKELIGRSTDYGFQWGAAEVTRICHDDKKGWVLLWVKTPRDDLRVYVTRTGKVGITNAAGQEWKNPTTANQAQRSKQYDVQTRID